MVHSAAGVWGTEVSILALATSNFVIILSENFIFFKSRAYNKSYDQPTPDTFHNRCSNIVICFFFRGKFSGQQIVAIRLGVNNLWENNNGEEKSERTPAYSLFFASLDLRLVFHGIL